MASILSLFFVLDSRLPFTLNLGRSFGRIVAVSSHFTGKHIKDMLKNTHLVCQMPQIQVMNTVPEVNLNKTGSVVAVSLVLVMAKITIFGSALAEAITAGFPVADDLVVRTTENRAACQTL